MKIESIDQINETLWPELAKMEAKAAVSSIKEAIQKGNADWEQKIAAEKDLVKTLENSKAAIEQAKSEAEARTKELEKSLADVRAEVETLRSAQAASEANLKFQERMASLDEQFDLDDEDRQLVASDIKEMSDEAFAGYMKKCEKLMSGKKKGAAKAAVQSVVTTPAVVPVVEAIASITPIEGQPVLPIGTTHINADLKEQLDEAFGETIKLNGKTLKAVRAEKAAKLPQE